LHRATAQRLDRIAREARFEGVRASSIDTLQDLERQFASGSAVRGFLYEGLKVRRGNRPLLADRLRDKHVRGQAQPIHGNGAAFAGGSDYGRQGVRPGPNDFLPRRGCRLIPLPFATDFDEFLDRLLQSRKCAADPAHRQHTPEEKFHGGRMERFRKLSSRWNTGKPP
jgi:hypothetical protein